MGTGGPFPSVKRGRDVTLTTHTHLVPGSWMSRSYKSSLPAPFYVLSDCFTCAYFLIISNSSYIVTPLLGSIVRVSEKGVKLTTNKQTNKPKSQYYEENVVYLFIYLFSFVRCVCNSIELFHVTHENYVCMYVFIYCKWTQVRWQNYIDINNIQIKIKHQQ
jgi:hypothetical protein